MTEVWHVKSVFKGIRQTKMWIVTLPNGRTKGYPAHLYSKEQAIEEAKDFYGSEAPK